ncbi:hypothetical protein SYNGFB01_02485 [Synechococcus sp. GFB01]|nr:hypothetical protein SYNGFB01_02485 [Synechococcus sp. GFB01]
MKASNIEELLFSTGESGRVDRESGWRHPEAAPLEDIGMASVCCCQALVNLTEPFLALISAG